MSMHKLVAGFLLHHTVSWSYCCPGSRLLPWSQSDRVCLCRELAMLVEELLCHSRSSDLVVCRVPFVQRILHERQAAPQADSQQTTSGRQINPVHQTSVVASPRTVSYQQPVSASAGRISRSASQSLSRSASSVTNMLSPRPKANQAASR